MINLKTHIEARFERKNYSDFYHSCSKQVGDSFDYVSEDCLDRIQENPYLYQSYKLGIRKVIFRRFKEHYIAYIVYPQQIFILAFGHAKRLPYYFTDRLK